MNSCFHLAAIVWRAAERQGVQVDADAAVGLATHARGTPREALRLLERVLIEPGEKHDGN